jgi:hypothetical protein
MSNIIENLTKELFNEDKEDNLYAIVDSAVDKMIDGHFESDDAIRYILYKDEEDKRDLELRAPHLVVLNKNDEFTKRVLSEGYGNNWGCFIKSSESIEVLVEHFCNYTKVYSEAHEQDVYIRFYDPRAINKYFSILQQEEGKEFFSKVEAVYVEKVEEAETLLKYSLNKEEMIQRQEISLEDEV